jgi:hypothetical protein
MSKWPNMSRIVFFTKLEANNGVNFTRVSFERKYIHKNDQLFNLLSSKYLELLMS